MGNVDETCLDADEPSADALSTAFEIQQEAASNTKISPCTFCAKLATLTMLNMAGA